MLLIGRGMGRSGGFAFIKMPNDSEAESAVAGPKTAKELDRRFVNVKLCDSD